MIRVREVKPYENYKLLIIFTNGETRIFDMEEKLGQKAFSPLKDLKLFKNAKVQYGTVVWNDEIDY